MSVCVACQQPPPFGELRRCPLCTVVLCVRCSLQHRFERYQHGDASLCRLITAYADMYAAMRQREAQVQQGYILDAFNIPDAVFTPEPEDWAAARQAYAYAVRSRARC